MERGRQLVDDGKLLKICYAGIHVIASPELSRCHCLEPKLGLQLNHSPSRSSRAAAQDSGGWLPEEGDLSER
jgi:hypothetical protein